MPTFSSWRNQSFGLQGKYTACMIGILTINGLNKQTNKQKNNIVLQCSQFLTSENSISQANKMEKNTCSGISRANAYINMFILRYYCSIAFFFKHFVSDQGIVIHDLH